MSQFSGSSSEKNHLRWLRLRSSLERDQEDLVRSHPSQRSAEERRRADEDRRTFLARFQKSGSDDGAADDGSSDYGSDEGSSGKRLWGLRKRKPWLRLDALGRGSDASSSSQASDEDTVLDYERATEMWTDFGRNVKGKPCKHGSFVKTLEDLFGSVSWTLESGGDSRAERSENVPPGESGDKYEEPWIFSPPVGESDLGNPTEDEAELRGAVGGVAQAQQSGVRHQQSEISTTTTTGEDPSSTRLLSLTHAGSAALQAAKLDSAAMAGSRSPGVQQEKDETAGRRPSFLAKSARGVAFRSDVTSDNTPSSQEKDETADRPSFLAKSARGIAFRSDVTSDDAPFSPGIAPNKTDALLAPSEPAVTHQPGTGKKKPIPGKAVRYALLPDPSDELPESPDQPTREGDSFRSEGQDSKSPEAVKGQPLLPDSGEARSEAPDRSEGGGDVLEQAIETIERPWRVDGRSTVADLLVKWAALDCGDRVFACSFVSPSQGHCCRTALTTRELLRVAKRMAGVLKTCYQVAKGAVVCNLLPPSPERVVLDMGIMLAGAVVLSLEGEPLVSESAAEPLVSESAAEYSQRVRDALTHSECQLVFCLKHSPFYNHCRHNMEVTQEMETLTVVGMTRRERYSRRERNSYEWGFLHSLWTKEDIDEFVEPSLKADDPAAVFQDTSSDGIPQLVFYQHQAILQLGAQLTQVLRLDRQEDVFFNPCLPSQPWGFLVAYLFCGVHTLAYDLVPGDFLLSISPRRRRLVTHGWPRSELLRSGVTVALFLPPMLNLLHDNLVAQGESFQSPPLAKPTPEGVPYLSLRRAAIGGNPVEIEEGVRMLQKFEVGVIKVLLVHVCVGVMTSLCVPESWRDAPEGLRRGDVGKCLTHLQFAMEHPKKPGEVLPCLKEGDERQATPLVVRSLYNMPCPIKRYDGIWACWEPYQWTALDLMGYVDRDQNIHVVGNTRQAVPAFNPELKRWVTVHLDRVSKWMKDVYYARTDMRDVEAVYLTVESPTVPLSFNHELLAIVLCKTDASWRMLLHQMPNEFSDARMCRLMVKGTLGINHIPQLESGDVDRAMLMRLAWNARRTGRRALIVIPPREEDLLAAQEPRQSRVERWLPCLFR